MKQAKTTDIPLAEIENLLEYTVSLDEENPEALIALANFHLNVMDDAVKAEPLFDKALNILRENAREALEGMLQCLIENHSEWEALSFLNKFSHNFFPVSLLRGQIADGIIMGDVLDVPVQALRHGQNDAGRRGKGNESSES